MMKNIAPTYEDFIDWLQQLPPNIRMANLHLRPDQIIFEKDEPVNSRLVFPVVEVQNIEISYNGHKSETYSNPRSLVSRDGSGSTS